MPIIRSLTALHAPRRRTEEPHLAPTPCAQWSLSFSFQEASDLNLDHSLDMKSGQVHRIARHHVPEGWLGTTPPSGSHRNHGALRPTSLDTKARDSALHDNIRAVRDRTYVHNLSAFSDEHEDYRTSKWDWNLGDCNERVVLKSRFPILSCLICPFYASM